MPNIWPLVHFPSYHPHPSYSFLFYNCPPDKALEQSYDPYSSSKIFRLRAFRFVNDYDSFYLHCELLACDRYSENFRSVIIVVVVVVFILFTLFLGLLLLLNFFFDLLNLFAGMCPHWCSPLEIWMSWQIKSIEDTTGPHTFKRGPMNFQEKTQNESGGKKLQEISDYTPGSFSD